jgi:hypothetical protein
MSDASVVAVGESPAQIDLPPVRAVLVINTSEGLGDNVGTPDVVVDTASNVSLSPLVGCVLHPGELVEFPMVNPSNGRQLQLWAVADGPGAQVTIHIVP